METLNTIFYTSMVMWILSEVIYKNKFKSGGNDEKKR